jgi:hypothetical protein
MQASCLVSPGEARVGSLGEEEEAYMRQELPVASASKSPLPLLVYEALSY